MPLNQAIVIYRPGFSYGMGVYSASAQPMAKAVSGTPEPDFDFTGEVGYFQLRKVESTENLEDSLHISADASGGVGLFTASGQLDFARANKVQQNSMTLLVQAGVMKSFYNIRAPELETDAKSLVRDGKFDVFTNRYGDRFVRGVYSGGQFYGTFHIEAKDQTTCQSIDTELSGSYGLFSAEVKNEITTKCQRHNATIECFAYHEGGHVSANPISPDGLMEACQQWTETVNNNPQPYLVMLAPYNVAGGQDPPNIEDLRNQRDVLQGLAKTRSQSQDMLNQVEYIIGHTAEFSIQPDGPDLADLHAKISADLDMIHSAASWACDHPKEAMLVEPFAQTIRHIPNYKLTTLPRNMPYHGARGTPASVPDFRAAGSANDVKIIAAASGLTYQIDYIEGTGSDLALHWSFRVLGQSPSPGQQVSAGATVRVTAAWFADNDPWGVGHLAVGDLLEPLAKKPSRRPFSPTYNR